MFGFFKKNKDSVIERDFYEKEYYKDIAFNFYKANENLKAENEIIKREYEKIIIKNQIDKFVPRLIRIRIKYFDPICKIEKIEKGDWIDLRCREDLSLKKGKSGMIKLGVAMELPKGYEALIAPRSSTFKNYGIIETNGIGIVDNSYNGDGDEWGMPVYATRNTFVPRGERICQFRIIENQPEIKFEEVETLGNEDRGGFGSTGKE